MLSVHLCLILLNSSWQNSWFNQYFPGLYCAYRTLPYTARLSRRPCFSKHIYSCSQSKSRFFISELLSLPFFQTLPALSLPEKHQHYYNLEGLRLTWPYLQSFRPALCFHFALTTLNALFLLPGWRSWGSHPLLPAFMTKWTLRLCCRAGENWSSKVQSPGTSTLCPVEVSLASTTLTQK